MRKKEKEITDRAEIESILRNTAVCRIALSKDNNPYVVPVNHGYRDNRLYVHSSGEGKKIEFLRSNNRVCFEVDTGFEIIRSDLACSWSSRYRSVIGYGRAQFVEDPGEKRDALDVIMSHHSSESFTYSDRAVAEVTIIRIDIESMTGKQSGY
jgi:nitroimidazol reductase NimA-like FMN-containing flavoprotein (pyridoxamine 5'-phosphate oxidase superfamily)